MDGYHIQAFQLTSSRRGWRIILSRYPLDNIFQLTSSRRGWQLYGTDGIGGVAFQLTSSRRGWLIAINGWIPHSSISTHILTKRMTASLCLLLSESSHFNSHPHEEDDWFRIVCVLVWNISTHILTKRMTTGSEFYSEQKIISTHILTKRMTVVVMLLALASQYFNSHPHEEDDQAASYRKPNILSFQLTSSRRGWPDRARGLPETSIFQLTSSRRGWRLSPISLGGAETFQLTSSRRGWPFMIPSFLRILYFNSHPHEEDDFRIVCLNHIADISTHILTKRMTQTKR